MSSRAERRTGELKAVPQSGLGILRSPEIGVLRRRGKLVAMTPQIRAFLMQPDALIITKSDVQAHVHRRTAMDYIGVKLFGRDGELTGELRIVGLFASSAYTQNPTEIPLLRRKLRQIFTTSGLSPGSHSGKALASVLEHFPRDELFQIDVESLEQIAHGILRLEERPRTRLFVRRDRFDRFVSAFVFLPRDRFNSEVRAQVGELLAKAFDGRIVSFEPFFGETMLVRVHYIVQRTGALDVNPDPAALERAIASAVQTWEDRLAGALRDTGANAARMSRWRTAFPAGYRANDDLHRALKDIAKLEALPDAESIAVEFVRRSGDPEQTCVLRLYRRGPPIPLSSRLPILTSMGFRSVAETTHRLTPGEIAGPAEAVIHEILLESSRWRADRSRLRLKPSGKHVHGGLGWPCRKRCPECAHFACGARLARNRPLTCIWPLYSANGERLFEPSISLRLWSSTAPSRCDSSRCLKRSSTPTTSTKPSQKRKQKRSKRRWTKSRVSTRIAFCAAISISSTAILRTNYFQKRAKGGRPTISFKLDSKAIEGLPDPRPYAEIFVYSPESRRSICAAGELRAAASDGRTGRKISAPRCSASPRRRMSRMPSSCRSAPRAASYPRDCHRVRAKPSRTKGVRAYKLFISSLLDLTDNAVGNEIVPPPKPCGATAMIPIWSLPPTRERRASPTSPTNSPRNASLLARRCLRIGRLGWL